MGFELKGFDELERKLEALGDVGNTISNKALKEGSQIVVEEQKKLAPRDSKNDQHGADQLGVSKIKKYKNGNAYIRVGLVNGNWDSFKGIYYQNFNGVHSSGEHVGWMQKAFNNAKSEAEQQMRNTLLSEIRKIF